MDYPDYYSSYETSIRDHELYDGEYDYYPHSSSEIDYFYNDNSQEFKEYDSRETSSHFSMKPNYFYPRPKRKHHFR